MILDKIRAMFRPPSALVLAARELEEAKRELLASKSACEYAAAMADYHQTRVDRLTFYLNEETRQ